MATGDGKVQGAPLTEAEFRSLEASGLSKKNYSQSGNYRLEEVALGGETYDYWIKWEGTQVKAYELAGGHLSGRYHVFPTFEAFYMWRDQLRAGQGFETWAAAWARARFSEGLQSDELARALAEIRANLVEGETEPETETEEPASQGGAVEEVGSGQVPPVPGGGLFGQGPGDVPTHTPGTPAGGAQPPRSYDDPVEPTEPPKGDEEPASPSDRQPAEETPGEETPAEQPSSEEPASQEPAAEEPSAEPSSEEVARQRRVEELQAQVADVDEDLAEVEEARGRLSSEEAQLFASRRRAESRLTAGNWWGSFIDRRDQLIRDSAKATIKHANERLEAIERERRGLNSRLQSLRRRRTWLTSQLGELSLEGGR